MKGFDFIFKLIRIAGTIFTILFTVLYRIPIGDNQEPYLKELPLAVFFLIVIASTSIIVSGIFLEKPISNWYLKYTLRKQKINTDIILDFRKTKIEILDTKAERTSYYEEVRFRSIGKKINHYISRISVDGGIFKRGSSCYNCSLNFNSNSSQVEVSYIRENHRLTNLNLDDNKSHYGFNLWLGNTFPGNSEFWNIEVENYVSFYDLEIIFPNGRKPKRAKVLMLNQETQEYEEIIKLSPLLIIKYGKPTILFRLFNLNTNDRYKACWDW